MCEIQICQQEEPTSQTPSEVLLKVCSGGLWETCSKSHEYHPGLLVTEDMRSQINIAKISEAKALGHTLQRQQHGV